jgi:DNA-binding NarL/FixJ family response regulator
MQPVSVVVFQSDPRIAQALCSSLSRHFHSVRSASSPEELRATTARYRAEVLIVDIEPSTLLEVEKLHQEFPGVSIVCTHRLADEEMWAAALGVGADDVLPSSDTTAILESALRNAKRTDSAAA